MRLIRVSAGAVVVVCSLAAYVSAGGPTGKSSAEKTGVGELQTAEDPRQAGPESELRKAIESRPSITAHGRTYFVIDGDILVTLEEGVALLMERDEALAKLQEEVEETGEVPEQELALMLNRGEESIWPEDVERLTYVVDPTGFSEDEMAILRSALKIAEDSWNDECPACRVQFAMIDSRSEETPLFQVQRTETQAFYAAAFFPHYDQARRILWVTPSFFTQHTFDRAGIMRHEFGHILGYRHEHIRHPSLQDCEYEDDRWVGLTSYDPMSVMHYLCDRGGDTDLRLTSLDIEGHRSVYSRPSP